MEVRIVGIDCATDPRNVGYAFGRFVDGETTIEQVAIGTVRLTPLEAITEWLAENTGPTLITLDAPLGWPAPLAEALQNHEAGRPLPTEANRLFRRETDRVIRERTGKQSLDVGADRIARTAHAGLKLLGELRSDLADPIPLASSVPTSGRHAIEVYPAATLAAHRIDARGYKATLGKKKREWVLSQVEKRIAVRAVIPDLDRGSDGIDAALCILAAHDFLLGTAIAPDEETAYHTEGWIWVRDPCAARNQDG